MSGTPHARRWLALAAAVAAVLAVAGAWAGPPRGQGETRVLAEVDGDAITADAVDKALGDRLYRLKQEIYQLQRQTLDKLIEDKLLEREAARRGIPVQRLLETEVKARVRVTDQELDAFYRERKHSVQAPEAAAREAFRRYLEQAKEAELTRRLVEELRTRVRVRVHLEPPTPIASDYLVVPGAAARGPKHAPVTIVEFSDFQCPFCARAQVVLQQVLEAYPKEVRRVYRHFPLERNPHARLAAEAAECAGEQGRFWDYHARVFASAPQLGPEKLGSLAEELRLDVRAFRACLDGGKTAARVAEDLADAKEAGVTGTPTFFINGRLLEGAQPFASFKRVIDQELALRAWPSSGAR
ncbi:MAG: thioredoxin domain-containing protein [Candidatus Rokubacteria bacterium]|nr:thioredoxin domain-containing protein [Candidatus Rokubacteria bacterium]